MDALPDFALLRPTRLDEALSARRDHPGSRLLGGGTDLVVNIRRGIEKPEVLIDLTRVSELRAIAADHAGIEIGASVTLAELAAHPQVAARYPVIAQAAASIAGVAPYTAGGLDWLAGMGPENVEEFEAAIAGEAELTGFLDSAAVSLPEPQATSSAEPPGFRPVVRHARRRQPPSVPPESTVLTRS